MNNISFKLFFRITLGLYLICLCWVLFFQLGTTNRDTYFVNPDDHFIPFSSTYHMLKNASTYRATVHGTEFLKIFLLNVGGNLMLLFPWGILAPLSFKNLNKIRNLALSGFLISLTAELIQYTFSLGIFDVDDLMFNTFGAIIGFYTLQLAKYLLKRLNLPTTFLDKSLNQSQA